MICMLCIFDFWRVVSMGFVGVLLLIYTFGDVILNTCFKIVVDDLIAWCRGCGFSGLRGLGWIRL